MMNLPNYRGCANSPLTLLALATVGAGWLFAAPGSSAVAGEQPYKIQSPEGAIEVTIRTEGELTYSVNIRGQEIVQDSKLGLRLRDGRILGAEAKVLDAARRQEDSTWENPAGKRRIVRNRYNELKLTFGKPSVKGQNFQVIFRVFDDGVAFRYELLSQPGLEQFVLEQELTEFAFTDDYTCFAGEHSEQLKAADVRKRFHGPQEWEFFRRKLSDISAESVIGLPVLVETPRAWVAIAEADLLDWAGMWITRGQDASIPDRSASSDKHDSSKTSLAQAPAAGSEKESPRPVTLAVKLAPRLDGQGLVKGETPHCSPWRVLMVGQQPGRLIESEIIRNLSTPSKLADTSWIKPGMMAWDNWWTTDTIMDTATIKSYIQFAADMRWEYQLIDWLWYGEPNKPESDITKAIPALDLDELRKFAKSKGVRQWLWLYWSDVDRNDAYKKAFPLYEKWGIAGVKIDYMDRDDQEMVHWYEKIAAAAAEHHLMVNFHGAYKPSGFDRTYPNQITREGVLANEYSKWSKRITPEHKLTLPFTRFLVGPGDFTPGGFLNRQPRVFKTQLPNAVQGTRAAELALFVCFDSPIVCVCDHPDHIRDQPGADFLKVVPTVWDETKVLDGVVGEQLVMVRQSGNDWYLGAMTNGEPRTVEIKLDFLDDGPWQLTLWQDAADSNENAEHLNVKQHKVHGGDRITLTLAPNGGCVGRFEKQ
ncbi:MAG: glycoside hydrolase family 97 protein [Pirellulales bacterium]|nr:glycoside hydrolase family 97 protein [Pirellulales bacterium]